MSQEDGSVEGTPGGGADQWREQAVYGCGSENDQGTECGAQNKESLMEIIVVKENPSDEQKQDAVNQMVAMTDYAEGGGC